LVDAKDTLFSNFLHFHALKKCNSPIQTFDKAPSSLAQACFNPCTSRWDHLYKQFNISHLHNVHIKICIDPHKTQCFKKMHPTFKDYCKSNKE
jgi:hypothetical protein